MNLFQIIFIASFIAFILRILIDLRKGRITVYIFLFWIIVLTFGGLIIADPSVSTAVAKILGISRGADVIVYISIIGLYSITFVIYRELIKINKKISKLNSYIANHIDESKDSTD